jgi:hypothetical protein
MFVRRSEFIIRRSNVLSQRVQHSLGPANTAYMLPRHRAGTCNNSGNHAGNLLLEPVHASVLRIFAEIAHRTRGGKHSYVALTQAPREHAPSTRCTSHSSATNALNARQDAVGVPKFWDDGCTRIVGIDRVSVISASVRHVTFTTSSDRRESIEQHNNCQRTAKVL